MKKNLIIFVSKFHTYGTWGLCIKTNLDIKQQIVTIPNLVSDFPKANREDFRKFDEELKNCFQTIFIKAYDSLNIDGELHYKCLFSDKYITEGFSALPSYDGNDIGNSTTLPMSEQECLIVTKSIPPTILKLKKNTH